LVDDFFSGVGRTIQHLQQGKDRQRPEMKELDPQLALLRTWQAERLSKTYADLMETKHFRPACEFFLNDIYAPRDFSQRDQDFVHIYELASRFIPESFLELFKALLELNNQTNQLDTLLVEALVGALGVTDKITPALYAEAYRICDNYADRKYQIDLLAAVIHDVGVGARDPLVWPTLQLARIPAGLGGWNELYEFATHGYQAFHAMRHPAVFSSTIQKREMAILDKIFAGEDDPFAN
jgi:hypothetical protein